jgi:hypothetical protein
MSIANPQILFDPLRECWPTSDRNTPSWLGEAVASLSDVGEVGQQGLPQWPKRVLDMLDQFLVGHARGVCLLIEFGDGES